jgi:ubiquinone/menaquinone biosynthesis C-methylase UbiE
MENPLVSSSIQKMYDEYYGEDKNLFRKREITAIQTLDHVKSVLGFPCEKLNRVIDVGSGEGSFLHQLSCASIANELYGVEISDSGVETVKRKKIDGLFDVRKFDGYHVPYEDKFFDLAFSIHVLEHVEHERLFLNELKRIAKKIVIEVPLEHTLTVKKSIRLGRPHGHINLYTVETFENLLETCGLRCLKLQVFANGKELECFVSGNKKGTINNYIRSTMLSLLSPRIATKMMTYMCTAYCEVI